MAGARRLGWAWVVVVLFAASGVLHVLRPEAFDAQMPDFLPARRAIVVGSGVVELALAAGLLWRRTRSAAAVAAAALLVLIFPGNLWQAWEGWTDWRGGEASTPYLVGTLLRLPLQLPLVWGAWQARSGPGGRPRPLRPLRRRGADGTGR